MILLKQVRDGNASDGHAISMKENISAGIRVRDEDPVRAIWIANVQTKEKIALRVEPIEFVETFRHLDVAKFSFRPEHAGCRADCVGVHQSVGIFRVLGGPEFKQRFFLEGAKKHGARRIRNPFFFKHAPQSIVFLLGSESDARISKLLVAERFNLLRGSHRAQKKQSHIQESDGLHGKAYKARPEIRSAERS